jgi:hypothetical protein
VIAIDELLQGLDLLHVHQFIVLRKALMAIDDQPIKHV